MAENKEITTLHPYMNRNKNRYPNVKDENIPDTIQRKMTAGTGINISPDNVISATGGDSYTRSETDALLDTKADKTALNNAEQVIPTDIAVKDGKLGLEHDTTWLTNQNAITLGDGLTYDEATKTLKASGGGKLPAGTEADPFILGAELGSSKQITMFNNNGDLSIKNNSNNTSEIRVVSGINNSNSLKITKEGEYKTTLTLNPSNYKNVEYSLKPSKADPSLVEMVCSLNYAYCLNKNSSVVLFGHQGVNNRYSALVVPNDRTESYYLDGTYDATSNTSIIKWSALKKTYNHYIVITDGTASNAIYLLIPSTNNIICNIFTDLDTLLGTEPRFIQASGVVTDTASKLPIVAIKWQGSFSSSKIVTISSEEATTKFTDIVDVVEPA